MKGLFKKKEEQATEKKHKKMKIRTIGTRKKSLFVLWILLIGSLAFGVYKNFTAIDQHTIHEKEIIENNIVDTNAVESFTKDFVKEYYTWENKQESIEQREEKISDYLTEDLQAINADMIRDDIPTSSSVSSIKIWSVSEESEETYSIVYAIDQKITEEKDSKWNHAAYRILLHQDGAGNMVITQNPTLWSLPKKSTYEPKQSESNGTGDSDTEKEVTEFLETFFTFYPTATDQELAYYVKNNALPSINKDYTFSELINPVFQQSGDQVQVWLSVKYLNETTKATQISQYVLILEKDANWMIVE